MNRRVHTQGVRASIFRLACLSGVFCIGNTAYAADVAPRHLGLEETATLAVRQQPQLLAQQAAVAALKESAAAAGELPDPRLNLGMANLPVDTFSFTKESMTQAVIGVNQMFPGGNKRQLATARARQEAALENQALAALSLRIARDAQLAWLDAYLPSASQDLVKSVETEYQRQVEWSQVAYKANKLSQEETLALRGMLEATRDRQAELQRLQSNAQAGLARWIGDAARRPLEVLPESVPPLPLAALIGQLDQHPELTSLREAVTLARSEVALAKEAFKPDWSVDLSYGVRGSKQVDMISLVVGVDLPVFTANRQDKRLAARLAEVDRAEQLLADRRLALKAELEAAYADWQSADARIARYEQEILPLANRRVESALAAYGSARAGYDRVLEARRGETETRLQWLALQVARAKALAQIRYFSAA
jgi:cobalt-zinc-cadmium efflux system outer membrane protein